ncbi:N-acetyl-D-Glu racemase DgcA [Novispirillum itersonii]|uniref:Dipeptide epimerase n=1 Tax=Novispirillum itersonii TaxID=189 RepID=A0A7W9ZFP7_NOVIT|nr:N-acetyl-D-Glu racemase DgcA [Novispirillum itersonii]MBB6209444.1 L-alanine-DL-glutamate epimerase-like enolase superfamily enzyme [Novispirillum itersonii]
MSPTDPSAPSLSGFPVSDGGLRLSVRTEAWPIAGAFTISRGSKTQADVVVAEVTDGTVSGWGECVPYARYGESVAGVMAELQAMAGPLAASGLTPEALSERMPAGAARNALDCALWDYRAKLDGQRVMDRIGIADPRPVVTAYTLGIDTPEVMAAKAARAAADGLPLLKIKVGADNPLDRLKAVHAAAPQCRLIVDANEGWTLEQLADLMPLLPGLGAVLVEQPLPAGQDAGLEELVRDGRITVPVCADESLHTAADLPTLRGRYQAINIKLDKTGGLTGALALKAAALAQGFRIMVGCMVGTSLGMAPAMLVAQGVDFVDLDGPLLLSRDRVPGLQYKGTVVSPPVPELWG